MRANLPGSDRSQPKNGLMSGKDIGAFQCGCRPASVDLMAALRAYEANQKVIQAYDSSLQKTVNDIGRV